MILQSVLLVISGVFCGLAVVLGAFGAHALKQKLPENLLNAFETGVQYQFMHGLALALLVLLAKQFPHPLWQWSSITMVVGVFLFSGSLYLLALTGIKWFGPVTPIGGVALIISWCLFVIAAIKSGGY